MRIADNKLKHISDFYFSELSETYELSEIQALFQIAAAHFLGFNASDCILRADENLNQSDLLNLYDCCKDLKKNIPIQYILGETEFYNLKLKVNPGVLIPRPETEELVDIVIKENKGVASALDIGTGSGCIPIAVKKNLSSAKVYACDISEQALRVAAENARLQNTEITFFNASILNPDHFSREVSRTFDLIISNPPYIKQSEKEALEKNVIDHEPHLALFVEGEDDIVFYKRIIDFCKTHLQPKGKLYFELNPLTANDVKNYANASRIFSKTELIKDLSDNLRFLKAIK